MTMLTRTLAAVLLALAVGQAAAQQAYPNHPVRIIVGFSAGGGTDISARMAAQSMTKRLGQNFIVENKPGAGGNIAVQYVIAQPADGYTLLLISPSAGIASAKLNPPYNIERDIAPVAFIGDIALAFYVTPSLPTRNMAEFIAYAKANPGKLSMASVGVGSIGHLGFELLKEREGLNVVHVPYKSSPEATRAVISGDAQIGLDPFSVLGALAESGKVRLLAVASAKRHPVAPNLAGMEESGVRDYDVFAWSGMVAPAATPAEAVQKLNAAFNASFQEPEIKGYLEHAGYRVRSGPPEEFGRYIAGQVGNWRRIIARNKIEFD